MLKYSQQYATIFILYNKNIIFYWKISVKDDGKFLMFKAVRCRIYEDPKRLQRILKTSGKM